MQEGSTVTTFNPAPPPHPPRKKAMGLTYLMHVTGSETKTQKGKQLSHQLSRILSAGTFGTVRPRRAALPLQQRLGKFLGLV